MGSIAYQQSLKPFNDYGIGSSITKDLLCLLTLLIVFYAIFLGSRPFNTPDEGRYVEVAREMVVNNDFVTPYENGIKFLDKPPLYYWTEVAVIKTLGLSTWTLRAVPAFYAILGCLLLFWVVARLYGRHEAWLAAIILGTAPLYFALGHYINVDMAISTWITASLLFFLDALIKPEDNFNRKTCLASVCMALGFLTKGLIAVVFPVVIVSLWLLYYRKFNKIFSVFSIRNIIIFAVIASPWFILAQMRNPEFFNYFFVYQHLERFIGDGFNNSAPVWFYLPIVLIGFFPWSFAILAGLFNREFRNSLTQPKNLFLVIWFMFVLLFFSWPKSKIVSYVLPLLPPAAILTATLFKKFWFSDIPAFIRRANALIILLCVSAAIYLVIKLFNKNMILESSVMWLYISFISFLILGGLIAQKRLLKYGIDYWFNTLVFLTAGICICLIYLVPLYVKDSAEDIAKPIATHLRSTDDVAIFNNYMNDLPVLLNKEITIIQNWSSLPYYEDDYIRYFWLASKHQDLSDKLIDFKDFDKFWNSSNTKFIYVKNSDIDLLHSLLSLGKKKTYLVFKSDKYSVLSNHKDRAVLVNNSGTA